MLGDHKAKQSTQVSPYEISKIVEVQRFGDGHTAVVDILRQIVSAAITIHGYSTFSQLLFFVKYAWCQVLIDL